MPVQLRHLHLVERVYPLGRAGARQARTRYLGGPRVSEGSLFPPPAFQGFDPGGECPQQIVRSCGGVLEMHSYEQGRLNLPFVGHCTFGKRPPCLDWDALDADVAVLGIPYDMGTQYRAGARFGPRAIREASTLFSFGHGGAYDHEDDAVYLPMDKVRIVDVGDADMVHTDTAASHKNAEMAVRKILERKALPVVLGGDHAVNIPCIRAFSNEAPIHIVQIDAHLDFVDVRHGVREGHGNPMRRASEQAHVAGITQLGIRNVSSTAREGYEDARSARFGHPLRPPVPEARHRGRCSTSSRTACATT